MHLIMDSIPVAFMEEVLLGLFSDGFNCRPGRLAGTFGLCARRLEDQGHFIALKLKDGKAQKLHFYDCSGEPMEKMPTTKLLPKYRMGTYLDYHVSKNKKVPKIDFKLMEQFLEQPGMLCVDIFSSDIDDKWIQLFSSWKRLQFVSIRTNFNDSIFLFLQALLTQQNLTQILIYPENYGDREVDLFRQFMLQKQFKALAFDTLKTDLKDRFLALAKTYPEKLSGKIVIWWSHARLHDLSFRSLGRVEPDTVRFVKENLVVDYYNKEATEETSEEMFMRYVTCTELRFVKTENSEEKEKTKLRCPLRRAWKLVKRATERVVGSCFKNDF